MVAKIGRYSEAIGVFEIFTAGYFNFLHKIGGGSENFKKPAASLI
jgi:hypothetical protein